MLISVSLYPGTFGEGHLVDSSGRRIHNVEFNLLRKHMSMDTTSIQISMNGIVVATMTIFLSNGYGVQLSMSSYTPEYSATIKKVGKT